VLRWIARTLTVGIFYLCHGAWVTEA
jgi:hypothetical protein